MRPRLHNEIRFTHLRMTVQDWMRELYIQDLAYEYGYE